MGFILKPTDRKYKNTNSEDLDLNFEQNKNEFSQKEKDFNPWDYLRVVNVRGEPEYQANDDEKVIVAHRDNPIFGNKHPMKIQTMKERDRVISEYKKDLETDLKVQGPMYKALKEIAKDIVDNKQKIALSCYCSPLRCHAEHLLPVIVDMAQELLSNNLSTTKKIKP
jgi:Domain of unknown function (DUF4326)